MNSRLYQRFQNFSKSLQLLEDALQIEHPSITEQAGIIQFFEMTFELAWKCLKDYFQEQGLDEKYPRGVIKTGIEKEILSDGNTWIQALITGGLIPRLSGSEKKDISPPLKGEANGVSWGMTI